MLQLQIQSDTPDLDNVQGLIESAINAEIKNLKRSIEKSNKVLGDFESKYQVSSQLFLSDWTAEDLEGGDDEYVTWVGEIRVKQRLVNALQKLEGIEYVTQHVSN
ncbi:MAG: hypothetical protein VKJ27_00405 [Synechocystis sp.]|nr:hypothetical protein [Synechocystis sp.]